MARRAVGQLRMLPLGSSGLKVTDACLGSMTWGVQNTEAEAHEQLDYAVKERGVNFVDTAEMYPVPASAAEWRPGRTEEIIGSWLQKNPTWRSRTVLASKVSGFNPNSETAGNRTVPPGPPADGRLDAASVKAACEASLRRLRTDYIDLYQLHWPDRCAPIFGDVSYDPSRERPGAVPMEETLQALRDLVDAGRIRHWGLSNETAFGVCEWARACSAAGVEMPASIQNPFSLLSRDFEGALAECCAPSHHNIGLLAWSPLCGGALTGKYLGGSEPPGARFTRFPRFQARFSSARVGEAVAGYRALAEEAGMSVAQLALQWCQSRWYVSSTVLGATTMEQLKANIDAFDGHATPAPPRELLARVDALHHVLRNPVDFCTSTALPGLPLVPGR